MIPGLSAFPPLPYFLNVHGRRHVHPGTRGNSETLCAQEDFCLLGSKATKIASMTTVREMGTTLRIQTAIPPSDFQ